MRPRGPGNEDGGEVKTRSIFVAWELVSSLKTAKGVIFEHVSTSYLFQRIKSPIFPNFHAGIIICIIVVISSLTNLGAM